MKLKLASKAKTLQELSKVVTKAKVLPLVRFFAQEYLENKEKILKKIIQNSKFKTKNSKLIVRSSSANEDNEQTSNAGSFQSVMDVEMTEETLNNAIEKVIASYGELNPNDEVFVQPMLREVEMAGVVFTADIDTLAPYYIVNYDKSGNTDGITSGTAGDAKTVVIFKRSHKIPKELLNLIDAVKECETIFQNKYLDIEFAKSKGEIYILQVRPIIQNDKEDFRDIDLEKALDKLHGKIKRSIHTHPKLLGSKSLFGVMPDWNPAEIIGIKPKKLALSLYKELVTDEIWAYQRDNYGYRNLRSFPLLVSFLGVPFIDVRVSFNSFIPKTLHTDIASKLVDFYLDELSQNRNFHDKVEFEIVYSCYYFGVNKKLQKLHKKGFNDNEIKRIEFSLLELTNRIIDTKKGLYKKDLQKVEVLNEKYDEVLNSNLSTLEKVYWLVEDCKRYGTLPFAGVARAAFIAMQFLNSFVEEGVLTKEEKSRSLNSLSTVSKQLTIDRTKLSKEKFLQKYGHLRPGTYDITSPRYDEDYERYFCAKEHFATEDRFEFSKTQKEAIERLIVEHGLYSDFDDLILFIKEAIEGREYAKFLFTRHLSEILRLIAYMGERFGISKEDLAHLDIKTLKGLYATFNVNDVENIIQKDIIKNRHAYRYTQALKLPSLIANENDIYSFTIEEQKPTFVTLNKVTAETVNIPNDVFSNKIVCIESADPGYDYLFDQNIAGLITCYGGSNSHMAIRCAELGIPAVIGCGEKLFAELKKSKKLFIDAKNEVVRILNFEF